MSTFGISDESTAFSLPEPTINKEESIAERKIAEYASGKEYAALKAHLLERVAYYQQFLPNGKEVTSKVTKEDWVIANGIIKEIYAIIAAYDSIAEAYKNVK